MNHIEEIIQVLTPAKFKCILRERAELEFEGSKNIARDKSFFGVWLPNEYKIKNIDCTELREKISDRMPSLSLIVESGYHSSNDLPYLGMLLAVNKEVPFWCYWSEIWPDTEATKRNQRWSTYIPESIIKIGSFMQFDKSWVVKRTDHIHKFGKHKLANLNPEPFIRSVPSSLAVDNKYVPLVVHPNKRLLDTLRYPVYKLLKRVIDNSPRDIEKY